MSLSGRAAARDRLVREMAERRGKPDPVELGPYDPGFERVVSDGIGRAPDVGPDYDAIGAEQVAGAVEMLDEDTSQYARYWLPVIHKAVGPLRGGDVHILGGLQGNAKTAVALNIFDGLVSQRVPTRFAGLEVQPAVLSAWWACLHTDIPRYRLRDGSLTEAERDALRADIEEQKGLSDLAHFANGYTMSAARVAGLAAHAARERGVKVVILDHLQHLEYATPHLRQAVGDAVKAIKAAALEHSIAFIVTSQLARRPGDKLQAFRVPSTAELKESSSIEQIADVVLFAHRGLRPNSQADQQKFLAEGGDTSTFAIPRRVFLHIAKHRFGLRTGYSLPLHIHAPCDRIDDDPHDWGSINREDRAP